MTTRRSFIKTLAALPPAFSFGQAWASQPDPSRLALVIGNSAYPDSALLNPGNDAKAVAALFTQAGFTVDERLNATRLDMLGAIERFGIAAKRPETKLVLFYYAGHGAQMDWRNYLLPVDAIVKNSEELQARCVDLSQLLGQFSAAQDKTFVIILDACRDNPFGRSFRPEQQGLSQFDAPVGSLLAYATSPGNVASDGNGKNGLYTENLVAELSRRGTRIEDALKRVRLNVRLASRGEQIPWETTSLESDVYIFDEGQKKLSETELEKLVDADIAAWTRIKASHKVDDWVAYLRSFPNGRFAEIAQMRLIRLLSAIEKPRLATDNNAAMPATSASASQVDQEHDERERKRIADEQRFAEAERQAKQSKLLADAQRHLDDEKQALAKPAPVSAPIPQVPLIEVRAGLAVPVLLAPSANPFSAGRYPLGRIYRIGDFATFQKTDILTGLAEGHRTLRVTKVDYDQDRVEFNGGRIVTDLMGNALKQGDIEFDTPRQITPAEFQVGKKWTASFRQTEEGVMSSTSVNLKIVKRETITVPAGTFDTFKIVGEGWNLTYGVSIEMNIWMVPGLNFFIRNEQIRKNRHGQLKRTEKEELVALRQGVTAS